MFFIFKACVKAFNVPFETKYWNCYGDASSAVMLLIAHAASDLTSTSSCMSRLSS
jgi:hypothetical protein